MSTESTKYAVRAPLISIIGENSFLQHLLVWNGLQDVEEKHK